MTLEFADRATAGQCLALMKLGERWRKLPAKEADVNVRCLILKGYIEKRLVTFRQRPRLEYRLTPLGVTAAGILRRFLEYGDN